MLTWRGFNIANGALAIDYLVRFFPNPFYPPPLALLLNNESSEIFDIIKPGRKVKLKGYRQ